MTKVKAWIAAAAALLIAAQTTLPLTDRQHVWVAAGIGVVNAILVYAVPNKPVVEPGSARDYLTR